MAIETPEEKRARLKEERDKLNKRIKVIDSRKKAKDRKAENHRKIVIGGLALKAASEGKANETAAALIAAADAQIKKEAEDREERKRAKEASEESVDGSRIKFD